ncbi:MAG: ChaN family lipoprotein [Desulfobacterales bacterium]|jgi:uncharacterized iron-regulated protein|nr:ChaN family lipoprotein [Desulfobacterales bacterium]
MKTFCGACLILMTIFSGPATADVAQPVFDLRTMRPTTLAELMPELLKSRIILVGEQHTDVGHHRAQLRVIQALHAAGARVAVGLEMFRKNSQAALDRWVSGDIRPQEFETIFRDNWGYAWSAYQSIFEYARAARIPMIGLNVPREITRQVARDGFQSLSEDQRGQLADVACQIDEEYMRYIRSVYGAHAHGNMNFTFFCEAQMVWDNAMAVHALEFLASHPETTMVILTGVGHAQNGAVPRQIRLRSPLPVTVFLPEVPGSIDQQTVDRQDADFLLMGVK